MNAENTIKAELILNTEDASDEITELFDFINESNIKGIKNKLTEKVPEEGTMAVGAFIPIITMILSSTVVAAGVKGLFDIMKTYFDLRKQKLVNQSEIEKSKIEQHKVEFVVETKEGKKMNIKFSSFDEEERKQFFNTVDKVFAS